MFEDVLATYGYFGVFIISLALNLLPFTSPSNMILAGAVAFLLPTMNPLLIGFAVALAASMAKTGHYYVASYVGAKAGSRAEKLASYGKSIGRWGALAVFATAASPIPDDPVVIPLGLTRYSPTRFFIAYLLGKAIISVAGAYLGRQTALAFETLFPSSQYILATAIVSVLIVSVLIKYDLPTLITRIKRTLRRD